MKHQLEFGNEIKIKTKEDAEKKQRLGQAMDTLSELLNIEFGSLTVHFHKGRWSPKVEIQKNVLTEINEA
ncbi:MAG: hypothetical protein AABY86_10025 [Bdellovibrionota bacterium]